ncbi:hypothetical protein CLIB1423_15S01794 [[Candida] railenensis]|uniref:ENTH domain-containing protein n=1 Tax=[Candida] railenensis TaxID=45579 RepID=A0A9P0VZR6_9ASCO|nr:hypothetical protein CLIB1423_15S01794 [[Candida] railenensis]
MFGAFGSATNNDPFGTLGSQLNDLAILTFDSEKLRIIIQIINKRLSVKEPSKNWRIILKTLTVIIYLLQSGSKQFVNWCKSNYSSSYEKRLRNFTCFDINGNEIGQPIRSKLNLIHKLINDDQELELLRWKFHQLRNDMSIPGLKMYETPISPSTNRTNESNKLRTRSLDFSSTTSFKLSDDVPSSPINARLDTLSEDNGKENNFTTTTYDNSTKGKADLKNSLFRLDANDSRILKNRSTFHGYSSSEHSNNPFIDIHT